jgi:hypothetical protein
MQDTTSPSLVLVLLVDRMRVDNNMCGELAASHSCRLEAKARWKGEAMPVNRQEEAGFRVTLY